jgi:hypothetical protein
LTRGLFCIGIVAGSVGAIYPTGFLGEDRAPGLAGAAVLGVCGAWVSAIAWGVVLGVLLAASTGSGGQRAMAHAHSHGQLVMRAVELRVGAVLLGVVAVGGAVGGVVSALAQGATVGPATSAFALSPDVRGVAGAAIVSVASLVAGYIAGTSTGRAATALAVYGATLCASLVLMGASYYVPALRHVASATPGALLVVLGRPFLAAPQFTSELSATTANVSSAVWLAVLLVCSFRRVAKGVDT